MYNFPVKTHSIPFMKLVSDLNENTYFTLTSKHIPFFKLYKYKIRLKIK